MITSFLDFFNDKMSFSFKIFWKSLLYMINFRIFIHMLLFKGTFLFFPFWWWDMRPKITQKTMDQDNILFQSFFFSKPKAINPQKSKSFHRGGALSLVPAEFKC